MNFQAAAVQPDNDKMKEISVTNTENFDEQMEISQGEDNLNFHQKC
jgi:hypothetical protein